jgi:hypothetical protein
VGSEDQAQADIDPEYEDWMDLVQQSRELLQSRADRAPTALGQVIPFEHLASRTPAELKSDRPHALAAESANQLQAPLIEDPDAAEAEVRYHEVPFEGSGKLFLRADEYGVCGIWSDPADSSPPRLVALDHAGEPLEATWEAGPERRLHRSKSLFPWVDGQVILEIAVNSPRTLTIQR